MKVTLSNLNQLNDAEDIIRTLSESLGSTKELVVSPSRKKEIVQVRDLVVFLLREHGEMSYPAIGKLLGGRDHTTIIHSFRKTKQNLKNSSRITEEVHNVHHFIDAIKERKESVRKELEELKAEALRLKKLPTFKEIPERNLHVLELYREGVTLDNIGNDVGLTRERVRQIVIATVKQMASNESISRNIEMDSSVMLDEEMKKRKTAQESKRIKRSEKPLKEKQWSRYYTSCKQCGTTAIPHVRRGLCEQCIGSFRGKRRENIIAKHEYKCDSCNKTRKEAAALYGRDLYITKSKNVLCKKCFRQFSGKRLGGYKNYEWSRFYPACKSCGTTSIPHMARGLCENCSGKMTRATRERLIAEHHNQCDKCGLDRKTAQKVPRGDLCVTKSREVLCRACFQRYALNSVSSLKNGDRVKN